MTELPILIVFVMMIGITIVGKLGFKEIKLDGIDKLKEIHDRETKIAIEQYQTEPKRLGDNGYDIIDFMSDQYYTVFGHRLT